MKTTRLAVAAILGCILVSTLQLHAQTSATLDTTEQLLSAAKSGDTETVKALLEKGADVNAKGHISTNIFFHYDSTALMSAAGEGHADTVKFLLDRGADINAVNRDGSTALIWAASNGDTNIVQLLLDKGAKNNGDALTAAAAKGHKDTVKLLLDRGADINAKDGFLGETALMYAVESGYIDMVNLLLNRGADINAKANGSGLGFFGQTALMNAVRSSYADIVKLLLDKGADINAKDVLGETALMYDTWPRRSSNAVAIDPATGLPNTLTTEQQMDDMQIRKLLLDRGADINAVDNDGETALGKAKKSGNEALVKLLRQAGATALSASDSSFNVVVASGTNTDSSGYVTNEALLTPFILTNSSGYVVTNAVLVKLMANKFIYKTPAGGGMMPLTSLPEDLQKRFGYDPQTAQAADEVDSQEKERQQSLAQQQRDLSEQQARRNAAYQVALKKKEFISCRVIQKIDAGLLVSSGSTILLIDYPNQQDVAADDNFRTYAFPIGLYSYTTVNNSQNTIHTYTCSINAAVEYYLTH